MWIILKKPTETSSWEAHPFLYGNQKQCNAIAADFCKTQGHHKTLVVPLVLPKGHEAALQDLP